MAKSGQMRWKQGDYISLGRQVSNFNKKIKELEKEEKSLDLPEQLNYEEVKNSIRTRKGFNLVIKNLKDFQNENSEKLVVLPNGELMSNWEYNILKKEITRARKQLTRELNSIDKSLYPYQSYQEMDIKGTLKSINNWQSKTGQAFEDVIDRIKLIGNPDLRYIRAERYRENYIKTMEKYSGYANYDLLQQKMESIIDPVRFYKYIGDNDLLQDLTYQSDETYSQERFNQFVMMWGIKLKEDSQIISKDELNKFNTEGKEHQAEFKEERKKKAKEAKEAKKG